MNMVGTPYSAVQRSACTVRNTAAASKLSPGRTMVAPWVMQPRAADDHAEAVIERHRNADPVFGREA